MRAFYEFFAALVLVFSTLALIGVYETHNDARRFATTDSWAVEFQGHYAWIVSSKSTLNVDLNSDQLVDLVCYQRNGRALEYKFRGDLSLEGKLTLCEFAAEGVTNIRATVSTRAQLPFYRKHTWKTAVQLFFAPIIVSLIAERRSWVTRILFYAVAIILFMIDLNDDSAQRLMRKYLA